MTDKPTAFFTQDGVYFMGTDAARGPWSVDHCHAGPVSAVIARALERAVSAEKPIARLTIDLVRPAPMSGFRVEAEGTRDGRTLATGAAMMLDREGRLCATASSLHLSERALGETPTAPSETPVFADAQLGDFPVSDLAHDRPAFGQFVELAYPPGETAAPGPTTLWMRSPAILEGEAPSDFQRLCPLADCGNATSRNAEIGEMSFVNADITIMAHRRSSSEWLASRARSDWNANGIGLSTAVIMDEDGPVATVLQTLVLARAAS